MGSKEQILARVRQRQPDGVKLPPHRTDGITYDDRRRQFQSVLKSVGGKLLVARDLAEADRLVSELPVVQTAQRIMSLVANVGESTSAPALEPHDLADVDVAIASGEFGVAENAAIWITEAPIAHRAAYFICQHLVLVLPGTELVDNMHQAYERLDGAFTSAGFGCFISGPSKTADIEQSLVIGAQGPRSLTVVLVEQT